MDELDDRLKVDAGDDGDVNPRSQRGRILSASRRSREDDDRGVTENRELSDEDRLQEFRQRYFNDVLPDIPPIPGYHVCWLSTTNQYDPIAKRLRQGYELIKASEVPGLEHVSLKTGEYVGGIGVNEMLAFKLPSRLYQMYMQEAHHVQPAAQEEQIVANIDKMRSEAQQVGGQVTEGEGMAELRRSAPPKGRFSD